MPQSFSNTLIHIVFSTKNRRPFIDDEIALKLFAYIGSICRELKCKTIIVGGHRDHVHVFCRLYRPISQSDLVKNIKANSSKWMKTQGDTYQDFYWQDGYAVFSVNQRGSENLVRYIKNQRDHHTKKTFKEEYRYLLNQNQIYYEEEYMWD